MNKYYREDVTTNKRFLFLLLVAGGAIFLFPNFYRNSWNIVDQDYYDEWQIQYDRMVIARLVKTRQDGLFSAGGLLGLGDTADWNYLSATHNHQINVFVNNGEFDTYLIYKSNPGFQGIFYGAVDKQLSLPGNQKIAIFRGITSVLSALTVGAIFYIVTLEFGWIAGVLTLFFSAFSIWLVLPAGSIFWNLWASYLPMLVSIRLLTDVQQRGIYRGVKIHITLALAILARILLNGFDFITTILAMTLMPVIYYAVHDTWSWKLFLERSLKFSLSLASGTFAGLIIMSYQISLVEGGTSNVFSYIESRFGHHFAGNSNYYLSNGIEATKISVHEVVGKYLAMPAINIRLPGPDSQILYWHLVLLFAFFTILYFLFNKKRGVHTRKTIALIVTTWVSVLAPVSWFVIFRPHSIIHTHVNTMSWQMPFTLMGFALCGHVISDLFAARSS